MEDRKEREQLTVQETLTRKNEVGTTSAFNSHIHCINHAKP